MARIRIGVFDSGIGGLTILQSLINAFPKFDFVYLGDTARLPYGSKSPRTISKYLEQNARFLKKREVDLIVVACNSASSVLPQTYPKGKCGKTPILGVIEPGAEVAAHKTHNLKVGVIGTHATIRGRAYEKALKRENSKLKIVSQACPLFVPLVEEGLVRGPIVDSIIKHYLVEMKAKGIDTLILGCTHYPLLQKSLAKHFKKGVVFVDSSHAIIEKLTEYFLDPKNHHVLLTKGSSHNFKIVSRSPTHKTISGEKSRMHPKIQIMVTDGGNTFQKIASRMFPLLKKAQWTTVDLAR